MTHADFLEAPFPAAQDLPDLDATGPGRFYNRELSWLALIGASSKKLKMSGCLCWNGSDFYQFPQEIWTNFIPYAWQDYANWPKRAT